MKSRKSSSFEFTYQIVALVIAIFIVHLLYIGVIRPNAKQDLAEQAAAQAEDSSFIPERSVYVVVKDYEQELCFILAIWALAIMAYKASTTLKHQKLLQQDMLKIDEGMRILPEDTKDLSRQLEALNDTERNSLLPRALLAALYRFSASPNIQDVATASREVCQSEGERLESELSMIRYIAWAIPSIGFIGTVRGIGEAMGRAVQAVEGDISGVTQSLGVAFNSTLIALIISIVLVFLLHQLQLIQERYVLNSQAYCEDHLVRHLHTR